MDNRRRSTRQFEIALAALTILFASGLSVNAAHGVFVISGATRRFWSLLFGLILVCWLRADRPGRSFNAPYEFDMFAWAAWPIVVPYYLYRTRGGRGLLLVAVMLGLLVAPIVIAAFAFVFFYRP